MDMINSGAPSAWTVASLEADTRWIQTLDDAARRDLTGAVRAARRPDKPLLDYQRGDFDLVVAMYHDQGHGPVKALGLESGVNITIGLPVIRTSVDHGTAFDIAGTGKADERSMLEAMRLAIELAPSTAGA